MSLRELKLRISPWLAFLLGAIWVLGVLITKRGAVTWGDVYPGVALIGASFVLFATLQWLDRPFEFERQDSGVGSPEPPVVGVYSEIVTRLGEQVRGLPLAEAKELSQYLEFLHARAPAGTTATNSSSRNKILSPKIKMLGEAIVGLSATDAAQLSEYLNTP